MTMEEYMDELRGMCLSAKNRLGVGCRKIATAADVDECTVRRFFNPMTKAPTCYTACMICAALGVSVDALFGIEEGIFRV